MNVFTYPCDSLFQMQWKLKHFLMSTERNALLNFIISSKIITFYSCALGFCIVRGVNFSTMENNRNNPLLL